MVFDNCQIDVYFHMRSHYSRLRNVHSVVDCSPPKTLKRCSRSESSFQHVEMANLPKHSNVTKNKHSCEYGQFTEQPTPDVRKSSSKTKGLPPRPKTRRHPEDLPSCTAAKHSISSGKSTRPCSKYPLACIGYLHTTSKAKNKEANSKNFSARTTEDVSCPSTRSSSNPNTVRNVRRNQSPSPGKSPQPCPLAHFEGAKIASTCTTPENFVLCPSGNPSLEDHEYLQFLLRITEDIIKNDLYSNKEMRKVFTSHVKANKDRLELNRMLLRIHELMKELNIPLGTDADENSTASWTDMETTMKNLLCREKNIPQEDSKQHDREYETERPPKGKCICFDLRATYPLANPRTNPTVEEMENIKNENYTPTNSFKTSLDRLTEHTEPLSSRATCKVSTSVSNFGDVDILPGFECLETPKVSEGVLCELYRQQKFKNDFTTTVCHCHLAKKKKKICKRKPKKRKKVKRTKKIDRAKRDNTPKSNKNNDTQNETGNTKEKTFSSKYNEKPIIIPLQEPHIQAEGSNSNQRNPSSDYVLVTQPIYLLKAFLDENPRMLIENESPRKVKAPNSLQISPQANHTKLIDKMTSDPKLTDIEIDNSEHDEKEKEENGRIMKETKNNREPTDNKSNSREKVENNDKNSFDRIENIKESHIDQSERYNDSKFEEIKNILMELTNFPMSSLSSSDNEREQATHFFDLNDGCTRNDIPNETEINYLCKKNCPNQHICEKLRLVPIVEHHPEENTETTLGDEYDYTPQKEENPKNYLPTHILQDFLTTREIQTEDLPHDPVIIATVHISNDKVTDTDPSEDSEVELNHSGPNEKNETNTKKQDETKTKSVDDYFAYEKTITEPKNYNLLMAAKSSDHPEDFHYILPQDFQSYASDPKIPRVSSIQTNATSETLISTATVEPKEAQQSSAQELAMRNVFPLFQIYDTPHDAHNEDSREEMHHRKVSILKNPIVQVPVDKIFNDNEESKKKGESIMKAVESVKDRQTTRDPFLNKVLQEIESSRETRVPEKLTNGEQTEKSDRLPGPSALKNAGKGMYYPSDENVNAESSYSELPAKRGSVGERDSNTKMTDGSASTEVSSEAASDHTFYPNLEDQPELRGTPSQIRQINKVNARLDQFRYTTEKDETQISETLDKLVETLKEQQEKEDQVQVKSDDNDNKKNSSSSRKRSFKCCGFCKRKKAHTPIPFNEPPQSTFSEEEYKAKSEAFEMALANLGQKPRTSEIEVQKRQNSIPAKDSTSLRRMDDYFGAGGSARNGVRLSLVRIADERESDVKELNDDFEDISEKISKDKDSKEP